MPPVGVQVASMTHLVSLGRRPGMPELYDKECFPLPISWTTSTGWTLLISTEEGITWLGCFMLLGRVPGFPGSSVVKNLLANAGYKGDVGSNSWVRKIPWRRKWQPNPVFLPGKSHRQKTCWATVHGITKSWTQLSDWVCTYSIHATPKKTK